jgi:hypothetical protein
MVRAECFVKMGFINEKLLHFGSEYYIFNWLMDNVYEDIRRQIDDIISLIDKILKRT